MDRKVRKVSKFHFQKKAIEYNQMKFRMLFDQTFQHRAKLSLFKNFSSTLENNLHVSRFQRKTDTTVSQLTRKRISLSKKGEKKKKSVICKISKALKGRIFSHNHKKNIRLSVLGIKNPMFGRLHSKISKRKIGKKLLKKKKL